LKTLVLSSICDGGDALALSMTADGATLHDERVQSHITMDIIKMGLAKDNSKAINTESSIQRVWM